MINILILRFDEAATAVAFLSMCELIVRSQAATSASPLPSACLKGTLIIVYLYALATEARQLLHELHASLLLTPLSGAYTPANITLTRRHPDALKAMPQLQVRGT